LIPKLLQVIWPGVIVFRVPLTTKGHGVQPLRDYLPFDNLQVILDELLLNPFEQGLHVICRHPVTVSSANDVLYFHLKGTEGLAAEVIMGPLLGGFRKPMKNK